MRIEATLLIRKLRHWAGVRRDFPSRVRSSFEIPRSVGAGRGVPSESAQLTHSLILLQLSAGRTPRIYAIILQQHPTFVDRLTLSSIQPGYAAKLLDAHKIKCLLQTPRLPVAVLRQSSIYHNSGISEPMNLERRVCLDGCLLRTSSKH